MRPGVSAVFLGTGMRVYLTVSQWSLCNRLVWNQEKLLKNSPDQRQGSQHDKPRALDTMQRDGKQTLHREKKTLTWDVRQDRVRDQAHELLPNFMDLGSPTRIAVC